MTSVPTQTSPILILLMNTPTPLLRSPLAAHAAPNGIVMMAPICNTGVIPDVPNDELPDAGDFDLHH